jgi:hypothetical protein
MFISTDPCDEGIEVDLGLKAEERLTCVPPMVIVAIWDLSR